MTRQYRKRIADTLLPEMLEGQGAVLIEGPKWCGKTTTGEHIASSVIYMDDPENGEQNLVMANMNPKRLLKGDIPRLIDEWQLAPKLWDAVRFEVDHRDGYGHFILTGSAVPADMSQVHHTGTGRFARLKMYPMSLYESGESSGEVSLRHLFDEPGMVDGAASIDLDRLAFLACRGGWPGVLDVREQVALNQAAQYYKAVVYSDINRVDNIAKNPERVGRLMRSLARNQGTQAANTVICADIAANDASSLDVDTVADYINSLRNIFVVEDMPAWCPNLRSKTVIRTAHTRYYVDPSIATAALSIGPQDLIDDLKTFGFIFETLCVRDLRVYADSMGGQVFHYRDKTGLECDAVVHLPNGRYGLIEIKLGGDAAISDGCATLLKLAGKLDTSRMREPSFMMVLTGIGTYAYRRADGVSVVPIGCLGP